MKERTKVILCIKKFGYYYTTVFKRNNQYLDFLNLIFVCYGDCYQKNRYLYSAAKNVGKHLVTFTRQIL